MNESKASSYSVLMKTPIGTKKGNMTVFQNGGSISGNLDILNHSEPFTGSIDSNGSCILSGKIVTLIRTIHFRATGSITADGLRLFIADGNNVFEITGTKE